mgnify:CR=1 FL=1
MGIYSSLVVDYLYYLALFMQVLSIRKVFFLIFCMWSKLRM